MIGLVDCHKYYPGHDRERVVLFGATCLFDPLDKVSILAEPGSGKTTLIRLLAGLEAPTSGKVVRGSGTSWPLGFAGAFHPAMTGEENVRTLAMLTDVDPDWTSAFVAQFADLGGDYYRPLATYSASMRARVAMSFSLAVPSTTYLADESIGAGSDYFRLKCEAALRQHLRSSGLFLVTRNPRTAERFGQRFGVLREGRFTMCDSFADAQSLFEAKGNRLTDLEELVSGFRAA